MSKICRNTLALAASVALTACGGGGGEAKSTSTPSGGSTGYPAYVPVVGDYAVYRSTSLSGVTGSTTTSHITRVVTAVNPGGSWTRKDSNTASTASTVRTFNSANEVVSTSSGTNACQYSVAWRANPAVGTAVQETYETASRQVCTNLGVTTTTDLAARGTVEAWETVQVAAGQFSALKYTDTNTSTSTAGTGSATESCWTDATIARVVKCSTQSTYTPAGGSASPASSTLELLGYTVNGVVHGTVDARFAGRWSVSFAGSRTGSCSGVLISETGAVSGGTCTGGFTVSGSVRSSGAATATTTLGDALSGTFDTPLTGAGTWVNGSLSGTWSASKS